jgi:hypothetical protein
MRRISAALVALGVFPAAVTAQGRVRGSVVDDRDNRGLANVIVMLADVPESGVRTNDKGEFAITVGTFPLRLVGVKIGFEPDTIVIADSTVTPRFRLRAVPLSVTPALIAAERTYSAASSSAIRSFDIALRPRTSSQELLRLAPGLVIAQHAGGGKAEQLYLRGFDADHGTDVAISVDGIPVNMVTHAHGQGYADVHWLMPDVVEAVDVRKGPFDVRDGDFATAGSVSFRLADRLASRTSVRTGDFGLRQATLVAPFGGDATSLGGYLAGSVLQNDGPFEMPQGHRRLNAFGRMTAPLGSAGMTATVSAFDASWEASGQVPDRAVRSGAISRFGVIDATEGGSTSRYDVSIGSRSRSGPTQWETTVFATRYTFDLYSNFTFFLSDSINGDGIEQVDDRVIAGASGFYRAPLTLFGRDGFWSAGLGARADDGDVALHSQRERTRLGTRVDAHNRQLHLSQWARYDVALSPRLRADLGARVDAFRFAISDRIMEAESDLPHGSGTAWHGIVSPRLNVAFHATNNTQLFANGGTGFHSNDGRDVILAGRDANVLPRAVSGELGVRHSWTGGTFGAALWWLDLQSETVFVGDEGTTQASGRTRRAGVDIELRHQLTPTLWFDGDLNLARGRFVDEPRDANRIPLAPTRTATAGLTSRRSNTESGIRMRHIGSRAANEDHSVRALGSTLSELFGTWMVGPLRLTGTVDNLFNSLWNEAQFATTSRLRDEPAEVTELHYTPGSPRTVSLAIAWRF